MNYLLIKNGLIVTGNKVFKADMLIGNETIIEISSTIVRPDPMTPVIDAGGRFIIPGGVDFYHYDLTGKDIDTHERDKLVGVQVINGTTTLFETIEPEKSADFEPVIEQMSTQQQAGVPDFAYHFSPMRYRFESEQDLFECYVHFGMSTIYINQGFDCFRHESLFKRLYAYAERFNLTVIIEIPDCLDFEWVGGYTTYTIGEGGVGYPSYLEKVLQRLRNATFPVLLTRLRYREEIEVFQKYHARNKNMYAEIEMPCSLGEGQQWGTQTREDNYTGVRFRPIGHEMFCKLISQDNYLVARPSFKLMIGNSSESPVFNRPDKFFGLKYYSSMLYTLTVVSGRLAITDFVNNMSTKPAMLMGLYPQKGVVRIGSDADFMIWNPDVERNLYCNFFNDDHSEEWKLHGRPEFVFCKGKMVYDGETFFSENLNGHYLYRSPGA
ncbi:amidohydrolase family protein [Breznakibacter xylanolyticus]|uniref:Amidohydrolase family protein n=1 Tax=Breznakibacter xylanolyticus TaxID=990 RepID=A0A2W7NGR5_9BACT|nr:amidohydrolase family protein [Breznakibacter xylanolyticus]PZX12326.1 amidohydrolase family protein [Breznakibacter xylanolyticus]